jgi:hypothetical protein
MVEATLSLSKSMEASGVSGVGTAKSMIGERVEDLVSKGYDRNLATNKAMSSINAFDRGQTDRTVSFGNIIEQNKLRQLKGGQDLTQRQMNNLVDLDSTQLASIAAGTPEGIAIARKKGLDEFFKNKENAQAVNRIKVEKFIDTQTGGIEISPGAMTKMTDGQKLNAAERAVVGEHEEELRLRLSGKGGKPTNQALQNPVGDAGKAMIQKATQAEMNIEIGAVAVKAMGGLSKVLEDVIKVVDPKTFGAEIHKSAADFTTASFTIRDATKELLESVMIIQKMSGAGADAMGKNASFRPAIKSTVKNANKNYGAM